MKNSLRYIIIGVCICVIAVIVIFAVKSKNKPASNPTEKSDSTISEEVRTGENTFAKSGIPLPEGKNLLTERSFSQCMTDIDKDGQDDRITCATLDDEYETAYICVQYADGKTPDADFSLYNGYTHPELYCGMYGENAVIYIKGESQGSSGEQMVHPFVLNSKGEITPVINPDAEYLGENSVYDLPCFSQRQIGTTYAEGRIAVETEYAPTLYITVPEKVQKHKAYDEEYGLKIESENCEMTVDAENNEIECRFDCSVIDTERCRLSEATPVTLIVKLAFDGETFGVESWEYDIADGTEYSYEGDIPAPSPIVPETTSPMGIPDDGTHKKTVVLKAVNDATVTGDADFDGDGEDERMEIVTKDYESKLTIYSGGKAVFTYEGEFIEAYAADLTCDGRYALLVQKSEEAYGEITAYFYKNGKMKQIRIPSDLAYENEAYGYIESIVNGEITFSLRTDLMGTRDWYHTAVYDAAKKMIILTKTDYVYPFNDAFYVLKKNTTAKDENGKDVKLKAGEKLLPVSSDWGTYIWYKTEKGNLVSMTVQKDDWQYVINGVLQDDLFEDIGYAG